MVGNTSAFFFLLIFSVLLGLTTGNATATGAPAIEWQKLLGGSDNDLGNSIRQTGDMGYILAGNANSSSSGDVTGTNHGAEDVWVVKLDSAGTLAWQTLLGGSSPDFGNSIMETSDGGSIIAGSTLSGSSGDVGPNHGSYDAWVVKLDSAGTLEWQKVLGGSSVDYGNSIGQTNDGGYILAGHSYSSLSGDVSGTNHGNYDIWVVKLDSAGTPEWQKLLGGSSVDYGNSIGQTSDGGYILTGQTYSSHSGDVTGTSHGSSDAWVVKLNSAGTLVWQKLLGGSGGDIGQSIMETSDGGYILAGQTSSNCTGDVGLNHGGVDVWAVKLNRTGTIQWQKVLGGTRDEKAYSIRQAGNSGYILAGYTWSSLSGDVTGTNHGTIDVWVVKLNSAGTLVWQELLGGSNRDYGQSIMETSDDGFILAGYTYSSLSGNVTGTNHGGYDVWVVKLSDNPIRPLPGYLIPPTDPDGDGIYEDLNANNRLDFADVVLYFNQMSWIAENEPIAAFDLNGNGRIDFADIVALFNEI